MTTAEAIAHHDRQAGVFLTLASLAEQRGDQVAADAHTAAYTFEKEWADELRNRPAIPELTPSRA